jgi:hypothetical protein
MADDDFGFVPDEEEVAKKIAFTPEPEESMKDKLKRYGVKGLEGLQKVGQYIQGATVSPLVAMGTEAYTGKEITKPGEYMEALTGGKPYPTPSEILDRGGVGIPQGYKVSDVIPEAKDKWYDFSTGGAAKLGLDIATDPATYLSMGLSGIAREGQAAKGILPGAVRGLQMTNEAGDLNAVGKAANVVMNPVEAALTKGPMAPFHNNRNYQKAFEEIDRYAEQNGKPIAISKLLQNHGFSGNMDKALDKVKDINGSAGRQISILLDKASKSAPGSKAASVDLYTVFQPAMDLASSLRGSAIPEAKNLAKQIDERVLYAWQSAVEKTGGTQLPVNMANREKSFLNQIIKDSGFAKDTDASIATKAQKAISSDLTAGIMEAVKAKDPQLARKLKLSNEVYSSTSPLIQEKIQQVANRVPERRGPLGLTQVDMMLLGGALAGEKMNLPELALPSLGAFALKKGAKALSTTELRTARGKLGTNILKGGGIGSRVLYHNPWDLEQEKKP